MMYMSFIKIQGFPKIFYSFAKLFKNKLSTELGHDIAASAPHPYNEIKDGVVINQVIAKKHVFIRCYHQKNNTK